MAHEIYSTDSMFSASRVVPWHGLGQVISDAPNSEEAIKLAGLDWEVVQTPALYRLPSGDLAEVPEKMINYRSDNGQPVGDVSIWYKPVQNHQCFTFTDQLVGEGVTYETAGSLRGGRTVWMLAKLPERTILGDSVEPYLCFSNSHDGTAAARACITPIRVVCANTLNFALSTCRRSWSFPHTGKIELHLKIAQATLANAGRYMDGLTATAEDLAKETIAKSEYRRLVENLFPLEGSDRKQESIKQEIERFRTCLDADDLANFRDVKGDLSHWGFMAAISDFATHVKPKTERGREILFEKTIKGHEMIDQAYTLLKAL